MPPTHTSSTSRALYRVFIAPNLRSKTPIPLLWAPAFAAPRAPSHTTIRTKSFKKDTARHALTDHYTLNAAIPSSVINLVDEDGTFTPRVPTTDALRRINRVTQYLVQLTPGKVDEFGNYDPEDLPTCRVVTKMALREQHERKLDLARRQAKGQTAGPAPKNLELNWAIAGGDMKHRMARFKEFLSEGRKVEVMLGPKKKGRKATEQEVNEVMEKLAEAVKECKGAREVKREGDVGGVLMVTFEGGKEAKEKKKAKEQEAS